MTLFYCRQSTPMYIKCLNAIPLISSGCDTPLQGQMADMVRGENETFLDHSKPKEITFLYAQTWPI